MPEKKPVIIERDQEQNPSVDFTFLRQHGIALVQQLSGDTWTDYNLHDPGVTILEQLCFAITDLAYRTGFPVQDLLADREGNISRTENTFFSKKEVLTTTPITIADFRKAILDEIAEVHNVWLEPVLSAYSSGFVKGLYDIRAQLTREAASAIANGKSTEEEIRKRIRKYFTANRNLCEDFVRDVVILRPMKIGIAAEVIIADKMIPESVLTDICRTLDGYFLRPVRYFSENELIATGCRTEEIYSGPLLKNGFIPDSELMPRCREISQEDLVRTIMQVTGVVHVRHLAVILPDGSSRVTPCKLDDLSYPELNEASLAASLRFFKEKHEMHIRDEVYRDIRMKAGGLSKEGLMPSSTARSDEELLKGVNREVERYYSIQRHFPLIYGIGEEGLPYGETDLRKAKVSQLKGYLLFFEQVLANYLAQLGNLRNLFSANLDGREACTYYYQPLYDVPGVRDLLKAFEGAAGGDGDKPWEDFKKDEENEYIRALKESQETDSTYQSRKNKVFDHLLARFNIQLTPYPVDLFSALYGGNAEGDQRIDDMLKWKSGILGNFAGVSYNRIRAFDYLSDHDSTRTATGFEMKMAKLLYLPNGIRRPLCEAFTLSRAAETGNGGGPEEKKKGQVVLGINASGTHEGTTPPGDTGGDYHYPFAFNGQSSAIFRHGLDISNYKIIPDTGEKTDYLILYREPGKKQWDYISRHVNKPSAIRALKKLTGILKQVNIASEGFHIVEHLLLRPPVKKPFYGFGFRENEQSLLFTHERWSSFAEREETIAKILDAGRKQQTTQKEFAGAVAGLCRINLQEEEAGRRKTMENLLWKIRNYREQQLQFFPMFEMVTKRADGMVIKEDFFNFRMTVVLPAWPARFQDMTFRVFTENLFRLNVPAHIRTEFLWLNIADMKKFEAIYFKWLDFFRRQESDIEADEVTERLAAFLGGNRFRVTHY